MCGENIDYVTFDAYYIMSDSFYDGLIVKVYEGSLKMEPDDLDWAGRYNMELVYEALRKSIEEEEDQFYTCPECGDDVMINPDGYFYLEENNE